MPQGSSKPFQRVHEDYGMIAATTLPPTLFLPQPLRCAQWSFLEATGHDDIITLMMNGIGAYV